MLDGRVYAMAGGTFNHAIICGNTLAAAKAALRGKECRACNSELRVKIASNGQEVYPDALIFCTPARFVGKGDSTLLTPKVVFEVLSETTEKYDRTGKFNLYKTIDTFEEYVLIEQDRIYIDHFWKKGDDWLHRSYAQRNDMLKLHSVGVEIGLDEIYDELELPESLFGFAPVTERE
ncbi:hypothetical protein IAD21_03602 [Abditibacteriota bacterium]|nr:hypothetical protein IAD21_03602 [Abditibacteriota bacterium]